MSRDRGSVIRIKSEFNGRRRKRVFHKTGCSVCGKTFRSAFRYDALCDLCWADNEMRPYPGLRRASGSGFVH